MVNFRGMNNKGLLYALCYGASPKLLARYNGFRRVKVIQKKIRKEVAQHD